METIEVACERCNQKHKYEINLEDVKSNSTLNLWCLNIKRLPRITKFRVDFTKNSPISNDDEKKATSFFYGEQDIDTKVLRKNQINKPKLWLIYDFDQYFEEIVKAYIMGSYYPVATSCTTLAERLINLFIIKMRDLYPKNLLDNKLQKYVYTKDQNWQSLDSNLKVLRAWNLLSNDQRDWFNKLLDIRNRAVHFQPSFHPQKDSLTAIEILHKIIDSYFSPFERKDIVRLFEIPGEIWVRENKITDPFVKTFVLPCCNYYASCGTINKDNVYYEKNGLIGFFTEEEFIEQRKKYKENIEEYTPIHHQIKIKNKDLFYRII